MSKNATDSIETLTALRLPELQAKFTEVTGEVSRAPNKSFLARRILECLVAKEAEAEDPQVEESAADGELEPEPLQVPEQAVEGEPEPAVEGEPEPVSTGEPEPVSTGEPEPVSTGKPEPEPLQVEESESAVDGEPKSVGAGEPEPEPLQVEEPEPLQVEEPEPVSAAAQEPQPIASVADTDKATPPEPKLCELSVEELRAKYLAVIGRATKSHHKRYLCWRLREALKGRVRVGPKTAAGSSADSPTRDQMVLPFRMDRETVAKLDEAWKRLGLKSRVATFRQALHVFLAQHDEDEVASLFAPPNEA